MLPCTVLLNVLTYNFMIYHTFLAPGLIHLYKLTLLIYVKLFVLPERRSGVVSTSKAFCPAGHCFGNISECAINCKFVCDGLLGG